MFVQAHNAQAVVTEQEIVLAAEISTEPVDFSLLAPMMTATRRELEQAGIDATPKAAVADAGYWNERHMDQLAADGIAVLIRPDSGNRKDERRGWTGGRYSSMRQLLATDLGAELYRKRRHTIEPMFGHTKHNRKFTHFHRRGRAAVRTEWRLLMATHNLTKAPHPPDSHPGGLNRPHAGPGGRSGPIRTTSPRATPVDRGREFDLRDGLEQKQAPLNAAADDCFARSGVAELTIELATEQPRATTRWRGPNCPAPAAVASASDAAVMAALRGQRQSERDCRKGDHGHAPPSRQRLVGQVRQRWSGGRDAPGAC